MLIVNCTIDRCGSLWSNNSGSSSSSADLPFYSVVNILIITRGNVWRGDL